MVVRGAGVAIMAPKKGKLFSSVHDVTILTRYLRKFTRVLFLEEGLDLFLCVESLKHHVTI